MTETASPVEQGIAGRTRDLGSFTVSRLLPAPRRRLVGDAARRPARGVASSAERIERAATARRAQTLPRIPGDNRDFVPLPDFPHHDKDHE